MKRPNTAEQKGAYAEAAAGSGVAGGVAIASAAAGEQDGATGWTLAAAAGPAAGTAAGAITGNQAAGAGADRISVDAFAGDLAKVGGCQSCLVLVQQGECTPPPDVGNPYF